jgi:hypothetical protein
MVENECVWGVTVRIMSGWTAKLEDDIQMEVTEMSFVLISKLGFNVSYNNYFR